MKASILIYKEIMSINRTSLFEDQVVFFFNENDPYRLNVDLRPHYGFYAGTKIRFHLNLGQYPNAKPIVTCCDVIYHPNIDYNGRICFSMFDSDWSPNYRVEHYVNGLLWLLNSPNMESVLGGSTRVPEKGFAEMVKQTSLGAFVNSIKFTNIFEFYETIHSVLTAKGLIDAKLEESYQDLIKKGLFFRFKDANYRYIGSYIHSISSSLDVPESKIVKSVIFKNSQGNLLLVLSNGKPEVWEDHIQEIEKDGSYNPLPKSEVEKTIGYKIKNIPVIGPPLSKFSKIIVNKTIENQDLVYLESGVPKIFMVISTKNLFAALGSFKIEQLRTYNRPKTVSSAKFDLHWKCLRQMVTSTSDVSLSFQ